MVFNSLSFGIFFIMIFFVYFVLPSKYRWILLLGTNYFFYACSKIEYVIIIFLTTIFSYYIGIKIENQKNIKKRKQTLTVGIIIILSSLILFKYFNLFTETAKPIFNWINIPNINIIIPLGISFYTLQTISYLIDVYKEKIPAEKHFGYLAVYVSFFLTIFSGPIERGTNLLQQLHKDYEFEYDRVVEGILLITWGLFKKVVVADRLSIYVNQVYGNVHLYKGWTLIIATFFFGIQLYCDFSGYTDMAIGCAKTLGYDLIKNFNLPYFSRSIQEFWRRWHISLSTWFRDYLYIPLGGSRVSKTRNYFNLLFVFLISGIWHGANLTFAIWGMIHGIYQIIGKATYEWRIKLRRLLHFNIDSYIYKIYSTLVTFCLVNFAWIFFKANSLSDAKYITSNIFTGLGRINKSDITIGNSNFKLMILVILVLFFIELIDYIKGSFFLFRIRKSAGIFRWLVYYILLMLILVFGCFGSGTFIYSQF